MQAGRDGTYSLVPMSSDHVHGLSVVDAQGNPLRSSMLELTNAEHGNISGSQLMEGAGEKGQEVRYCVVLDSSFSTGDGSGQPTAITLPDGSFAYVNALPSTEGGVENGCVDGTSGYTLQLYDDSRHVTTVDAGGMQTYPMEIHDPELTLTTEDIEAMMLDGDTLNDRGLSDEEDLKIDAAIER